MQPQIAVIHINPLDAENPLMVEARRYTPRAPVVVHSVTHAIECLKRDPAGVRVITCKVILGDRRRNRRPSSAGTHVPHIDLVLVGTCSHTQKKMADLLSETQDAVQEAAKFIFLEYLEMLPEETHHAQNAGATPEITPVT